MAIPYRGKANKNWFIFIPFFIVHLSKFIFISRLETRTKEFNMHASTREFNPTCAMKIK